jgi:hypothetical protein
MVCYTRWGLALLLLQQCALALHGGGGAGRASAQATAVLNFTALQNEKLDKPGAAVIVVFHQVCPSLHRQGLVPCQQLLKDSP